MGILNLSCVCVIHTLRRVIYGLWITKLQLFPRGRFLNVSAYPALVDVPLDTNFPRIKANKPMVLSQLRRGTGVTDATDSKLYVELKLLLLTRI